jgi:hypothetical protein
MDRSSRKHRRRRWLLAVAASAAAWCAVPAAHALTGEQAVAALNAQRAASGIPAGIVHVPEWSGWCALHNAYERANGGALTHNEDPSAPGYTPEGARAGGASVLAQGDDWDKGNPWETAPIHLHQLLAPRLDAMGVDDAGGYVCATTLLSRNGPAPAVDTVYVYPGEGVRHRFAEIASENPYTPGERIGIAAGTKTGPYLYASVDGPGLSLFADARLTAATLTGTEGPVEVRTVDNYTDGLSGYLPTGGEVIPLRPLRGRSTYTAYVRFEVSDGGSGARVVERTWSFATLGLDPQTDISVAGTTVTLTSLSDAPATLHATRQATGETRDVQLRRGERTPLALPAGAWRLCLSQPAAGDYEGHEGCRDGLVAVPAQSSIELRGASRTRTTLRIAVRTSPSLAGRRLDVTVVPVRKRCRRSFGRRICALSSNWARKQQRSLLATPTARLTVARPARGAAVDVRVRSAGFVAGDVSVPASKTTRRYRR